MNLIRPEAITKWYAICSVLAALFQSGCSGSTSPPPPASSAKAIVAYGFAAPAASGQIDADKKTIAVTVPYGTEVKALVASFTTTGVKVEVGSTVQVSGATPNDFTSPVVYKVTAADGSTASYTVTVTAARSSAKAITEFAIGSAEGTIDEGQKLIAVTVPYGTAVKALVASFTTTGVKVEVGSTVQVSGATPNDFTSPVVYRVTAADGSHVEYQIRVTVARIADKAIARFAIGAARGTIDEIKKTIAVTVPHGTDVKALVASFTTTGVKVEVGNTVQVSGATPNDFTSPVTYKVTAADDSHVGYLVKVTVAQSSDKAITEFTIGAARGTIDEIKKTIAVTVPYGTDVEALVASFTTTGGEVEVGNTVQVSGTTPNDFTGPVVYKVTAADGSVASYAVNVGIGKRTDKAMTEYSIGTTKGTIDERKKTIAVIVPDGTDRTALVASFATTGIKVEVGATAQVSGATPNDFTTPVIYQVTAGDGSTAKYTVTVALAPRPTKTITAFSIGAAEGAIDEDNKTIVVTMPYGTDVEALVASFVTTGAKVEVGATVQVSGATPNDFTRPVTYKVIASDGSFAEYRVTVIVALNPAKAITAFSIGAAHGTINEDKKTIAVTVPHGTHVAALVASFTTTGARVEVGATVQVSGATANDFTRPVLYRVTAADGSSVSYTVSVTVDKTITAYSFVNPAVVGTIDEDKQTIAVTVPFRTKVAALVAAFATTGTKVEVGATAQVSGTTPNDFTRPVVYKVTGSDGTTAEYTVTVTVIGADDSLHGLWGSAANDVWTVGQRGTIARWNGSVWTASPSGSTQDLHGVWGSAAGDVWAVGAHGTIVHWNGSAWSASPSGTTQALHGVWGSTASSVWAVGDAGTILHWNGSAWNAVSTTNNAALNGIWGSGPNNVWAVGDSGTILHWDGSGWAPSTNELTGALVAIWGSGANDVWALGPPFVGFNIILHWSGNGWMPETSIPGQCPLRGVWGTGARDAWAVGDCGQIQHWNGSSWALSQGAGSGLFGVWGSAADDVWAVGAPPVAGESAAIRHWNGNMWADSP